MSAINLYTTKAEALYFKDSQRNSFYEFGGIQLLPNNSYTQKITTNFGNSYVVSVLKVADDSAVGNISYSIQEVIGAPSPYYLSMTPRNDFGKDLIYLKFTNGTNTYYTNPFYITALDEDRVTKFTYRDFELNNYESISLKVWFRQKSKQSELTTYYESSTGNTVTQAIKTNMLHIYESEFMSIDDLIMTAEILKSSSLYIRDTRYNLFEAVKIPELTQQENFGKIKFTLVGKSQFEPSFSGSDVMPDYRIWDRYNLNTDSYRDGTPIPEVKTGWAALKTGAWRYYEDSTSNGTIYGRLYNWYALMGIHTEESNPPTELQIANRKNIAPIGWSAALYTDWTNLSLSLGGNSVSGAKLKESGTYHWSIGNTGTNTSGFTALPGGSKSGLDSTIFSDLGNFGYWWAKDMPFTLNVRLESTSNRFQNYYPSTITLNRGASIRLIKDMYVISGFTTTPPLDVVGDEITGTGGYIPNDFSGNISERGIVYGKSINPTLANTKITSENINGAYTIDIFGLRPNTTYHIRAYALIDGVVTYANNVQVLTEAGEATVTTDIVTEISTKIATCGGEVVNDGGFDVTARGVCWNTAGNPNIVSNPRTINGAGAGIFISDMTGLTPGFTYKVRAYATNSVKTTYGEEVTFTALAVPNLNLINGLYPSYHAYSLRRLSNTFTRKCLRVRRTTLTPSVTTTVVNVYFNSNNTIGLDSPVTYISGTYTDATTLGEFAASSGYTNIDGYNTCDIFVVTWFDQSGNDKNTTRANITNQPRLVQSGNLETTDGKVAIRFIQLNSTFLSANDTSVPFNNVSTYTLGNGLAPTSTCLLFSLAAPAQRFYVPSGNSISYGTQGTFTGYTNSPGINRLYELIADTSTTNAWSNGSLLIPYDVTSLTVTNSDIVIGRTGGTGFYGYTDGYISEIMSFPNVASTANRENIESYINAYYSIW
jgi:uncharacterized protein (TIGR02145 family)